MADDFSLDLEELRNLQSIAKRPRVISLISSEIHNLEKLSKEKASSSAPQHPTPIPVVTTKVPYTPTQTYSTLSSFSWEQDNDKVKIHLSLEGVQEEKMEKNISPNSIEFKFHDVQGKNYQFAIPKLSKDIVPDQTKVIVKPTRIIVHLVKASKGKWQDLHYKEDKLKPNLDKEKDPMVGIMDLMKNMYEEGDEEMKKTIAKAWTDARSGKTADSLKGYR
ncbi:calcyclin-binding protein-like [Chenopodium quinoa]|uniref:Calcyclin-binding protein n=1 Tax=Chenopodium quinoa TaxID=63459 RepID=A0A803MIU1_CHEQI|nr:calcyclin-binding protein-like [Chenopodium quinoa]